MKRHRQIALLFGLLTIAYALGLWMRSGSPQPFILAWIVAGALLVVASVVRPRDHAMRFLIPMTFFIYCGIQETILLWAMLYEPQRVVSIASGISLLAGIMALVAALREARRRKLSRYQSYFWESQTR